MVQKEKVYSFPKQEEYRRKWIAEIHRENFEPTMYSKVCELHFKDTDFISSAKAVNEKTGKVIEAALKIRRLRPDAVLSQFPNLPSYLSSNAVRRESPESKKSKIEADLICKALEASLQNKQKHDDSRNFFNLKDLTDRLSLINQDYWTIVPCETQVRFLNIVTNPAPKIEKSLLINEKLEVTRYNKGLTLRKIGKFSFPCTIKNINKFNEVLDALN